MSFAKAIVTTSWDDGHQLDLRLADLLVKYGLPATFYVSRERGRQGLSEREVRVLGSRFEIGAHGVRHLLWTEIDTRTASFEALASREYIENVTQRPCRMFCFPAGRFYRSQLSILRKHGYLGARTVELLSTDTPRRVDGIWIMPTTVLAGCGRPAVYLRNGLRRLSPRGLLCAPKFLVQDWHVIALRLLERVLLRGGVFHLWGHSWEIESLGAWGPLEEVLRELGGVSAECEMLANGEVCSRGACAC